MSRSNIVALVLGGLAVVLAATGTAVAVTATSVNLADPVTPSRIARVDVGGRLTTVGEAATYSYSSLLNVGGTDNFFTSPTTARLVLTSITLSHPAQVAGAANTNLRVALYKATSSSTTSCVPTAYQQLLAWNLEPGDDITEDFGTPLAIRAVGTTPYCLDLFVYTITGSAYGANYYPFGSATWYDSTGSYKGAGNTLLTQTPAQVRRQAGKTDR